jgi:hypothetical protein
LIQKEQGSFRLWPLGTATYQKQYLPTSPAGSHGDVCWLVYLTWNNIASRGRTPDSPILGTAKRY